MVFQLEAINVYESLFYGRLTETCNKPFLYIVLEIRKLTYSLHGSTYVLIQTNNLRATVWTLCSISHPARIPYV